MTRRTKRSARTPVARVSRSDREFVAQSLGRISDPVIRHWFTLMIDVQAEMFEQLERIEAQRLAVEKKKRVQRR